MLNTKLCPNESLRENIAQDFNDSPILLRTKGTIRKMLQHSNYLGGDLRVSPGCVLRNVFYNETLVCIVVS